MVRRGIGLVYGGGRLGVMGAIADAVLDAGGEAIGVIPYALEEKELAHRGLTELHVVDSMHERKGMMSEHADAFVTLPGGFGTMEEFFEVLTWAQLGLHNKPCGLLNVDGYFNGLLSMFDTFLAEGFARPEHRSFILDDHDHDRLLDRLSDYRPPALKQWIVDNET